MRVWVAWITKKSQAWPKPDERPQNRPFSALQPTEIARFPSLSWRTFVARLDHCRAVELLEDDRTLEYTAGGRGWDAEV